MKPNTSEDLLSYLTSTLSALKTIKNVVATRNKTTKFKAIASILSLVEARLEAGQKYVKAGGIIEFDVFFHQNLYNPIIEWLADEIAK